MHRRLLTKSRAFRPFAVPAQPTFRARISFSSRPKTLRSVRQLSKSLVALRSSSNQPTNSQLMDAQEDLGFNILKSEITGPEFHDSVWGLVIYRCVEGNDAAWERMLEAIRQHVRDYLEHHPRKDLKDLAPFHDLHVIDDKALYGAPIHKLREHFKTWAPKNLESRLRPDSTSTVTDVISTAAGSTPRYNFFLAADESDVLRPDNPDLNVKSPLLKLVSLEWDYTEMFQTTHPYFLEGFVELDEEDGGWAEVYLSDYVDIYTHLQRMDWDDLQVTVVNLDRTSTRPL